MIQKLNAGDFDSVFEIMQESFPEDEYRPYDEQRELLANQKYTVYVFKDSDISDIKAFMAVWHFDDFSYIEHFAVSALYRNQGLGAGMLKEIMTYLSDTVCLEAELPDNETARRRIEFYKRNGFFLNDYPYMQPPISKGRKELPLVIMTTGGSLSKERFEKIKSALYRYVYKKHV